MLSRKYSNRGSLSRDSRPFRPGSRRAKQAHLNNKNNLRDNSNHNHKDNRRLSSARKLNLNSKNSLRDNSNPGAKSTNSLKKSLKEGARNMDGRRNSVTRMPSAISVVWGRGPMIT